MPHGVALRTGKLEAADTCAHAAVASPCDGAEARRVFPPFSAATDRIEMNEAPHQEGA